MPTGKNWTVRSFSISLEQLKLLNDLKKVAKQEGTSVSEEIVKAIEEHVKKHGRGNPQLLITHYVKPDEPQPLRVICSFCQGALTDGRVWCLRAGPAWIPGVKCYSCRNNRLRRKTIDREIV